MTGLNGIGGNGYPPYAIQQSLFNEIDTSGAGSITKADVEKAVNTAGGTTQAADALYAQLDPNNTGSVTAQQFDQNLPTLPYSPQIGAQLVGYQADGWPGPPVSAGQVAQAQTLFAQIDTNGDGSISKSELENAVTAAGGTTQAADALYAKLDPNNTGSVSEQQFVQSLTQPHHHHHGDPQDSGGSAQDALASLFQADGAAAAATSPAQFAQNLFSQIDTSGTGSITKSELEQAVTAAGGSTQAADALYAQLDPNDTGSVTAQQFAQFLQPPSPTGTTAQDAVLALLDPATQNAANTAGSNAAATGAASITGTTAQDALLALVDNLAPAGTSNSSNSGNGGTGSSGNTAQDALLALLNAGLFSSGLGGANQDPLLALTNGSSGPASALSTSGSTAQDALFALLQGGLGGATGAASGGSAASRGPDRSGFSVIALYQSQISQQALGTQFGGTT